MAKDQDWGINDKVAPPADWGNDDKPAAARELPSGMTPSTAGAGRGNMIPGRAERIAAMNEATDPTDPNYLPVTDNAVRALQADARGSMDTRRTRSPGRVLDADIPPQTATGAMRDVAAGVLQIPGVAVKGVADIARLASGDTVGKGLGESAEAVNKAIRENVGTWRAQQQATRFQQDLADPALNAADVIVGNPGALADQALPMMGSMALPVGTAAAAGKLATMGRAAQLARAIDDATVLDRANKARSAAVLGTTMAQNAGDTFSGIRDDGSSVSDAYTGAAVTLPFTYAANRLTGGGAEGAASNMLAGTAKGAVKAVPTAMLKEGGQEVGEETGAYLGETIGKGEEFDANAASKRLAVAGTLGAALGGGVEAVGAARAMREQRIKTLRDAGETAAADLLQQKHDQATATESVDAELSAMPGNDTFAQQYRTLRTSGMKPAEAAARSAVTVTYGGMAMNTGVPDKAMQAAVNAAQGMPLDKVPGFFQKFTDGLVKRGLIQPSEALAQIGPALEAARDDAMEAAIGAAYQPVQSVMNDALALETQAQTPAGQAAEAQAVDEAGAAAAGTEAGSGGLEADGVAPDEALKQINSAKDRNEFENGWYAFAESLPDGAKIYDAAADETYTVRRVVSKNTGAVAIEFTGTLSTDGGNLFTLQKKTDGTRKVLGDLPAANEISVISEAKQPVSQPATPNEAAQATPDQAPVAGDAAIAPDAASVPGDASVQAFGVADESIAEQTASPDAGATPVSEAAPEKFPHINSISELSAGPGGIIRPRAIADGRPLYRETNITGLDDILRLDGQADVSGFFVADNPSLAIGQGINKGVQVVFRPNSLSGIEHKKPGTGNLSGREYKTDMVAPRAVQSVTMPSAEVAKLRGLTRRALTDFDKQDLGDGRVRFLRKGLAFDDAQAQPIQAVAAPDKQAAYVGRDNTPLSEGGRPFKTRKAVDDARKLNNTLRMVRVEGGYALAPKTEAQIAAQERAAKRLRLPQTSPKGELISAHAFIASEGGLHADNRSDMGIQDNITIGNRKLFAGAGKGLTIERATERLIEEGYLQQGASHDQARNLINRSLSNPQYKPEDTERVAQEEMDRRFKEYEDQADYDDAVEEFEGLSDTQFQEIDDADIPWDGPSNSSIEDTMRALGFDEQEIQDAIANESRIQSQNSPSNGQVNESAGGQEGEDTGPRASPAGQDTGSRSDARRQEAPVSAPAAVSVSGNADGTLTVTGPGAAKKLQDAGVTKIMPTKDGVVVGKSQAEQAKDALSSRPEALIELRKRESILKSLLECMG